MREGEREGEIVSERKREREGLRGREREGERYGDGWGGESEDKRWGGGGLLLMRCPFLLTQWTTNDNLGPGLTAESSRKDEQTQDLLEMKIDDVSLRNGIKTDKDREMSK